MTTTPELIHSALIATAASCVASCSAVIARPTYCDAGEFVVDTHVFEGAQGSLSA
jgi:hypothetical protein